MSIHQKKKGYEKDDQNTICLSWQHLPFPNGRICNEGYGKKSRCRKGLLYCVRRHQHGGDRKSGAPRHQTEAAAVRHLHGGKICRPASERRL